MSDDEKDVPDGFDKPLARDSKAVAIVKTKKGAAKTTEPPLPKGLSPAQDRVAKYLEEITAKFRPSTNDMDAKVALIETNIAQMGDIGSSNKQNLSNILSAVLGVPVDYARAQNVVNKTKGCLVVPLTNQGGHNYPLGKPIMITEASSSAANCIHMASGNPGNTIRLEPQYTRVATTEEVYEFVAVCPFDKLCKVLNVLVI